MWWRGTAFFCLFWLRLLMVNCFLLFIRTRNYIWCRRCHNHRHLSLDNSSFEIDERDIDWYTNINRFHARFIKRQQHWLQISFFYSFSTQHRTYLNHQNVYRFRSHQRLSVSSVSLFLLPMKKMRRWWWWETFNSKITKNRKSNEVKQ